MRCSLPELCALPAEPAVLASEAAPPVGLGEELLRIVVGGVETQLIATRQRAHSDNNAIGCVTADTDGDATGHRSSGGAARLLCWWLLRAGVGGALAEAVVVELGSGLGHAGIFAAQGGARCVVFTDGDPRALALCARSARLNGPTIGGELLFAPLCWGSLAPAAAEALLGLGAGAVGPVLVLGADVVYYTAGTQELLATVASLLEPRKGRGAGLAALALNPRYTGWLQDLLAGCALHRLTARSVDPQAVVPEAELKHGWFGHTRLVLLWREGSPTPRLALSEALNTTALHLAEAQSEGAEEAQGWDALSSLAGA